MEIPSEKAKKCDKCKCNTVDSKTYLWLLSDDKKHPYMGQLCEKCFSKERPWHGTGDV